jgi:acyl-CoA reductase-like NAD-dependent aldehyde dehydrogenase
LLRAANELERQDDLGSRIARELGLRADEFASRHSGELYRLHEALEMLVDGESAQGVGFFQAHWSDLAAGLLMRVAPQLVAGQAVIVLGDARLPLAAQAVARALETADVPRGVVALLFDDHDGALNAAASSPGLAWLRLKDHDRRLDTLRERWGVRCKPEWTWWPVRARSQVVARDDDPELAAQLAVEQSIARAATLSAQFPGHTARVLCHQRLFSRFTEELLARLGASADVLDPVPAIEGDLDEYVRGAWELGLDEGATPLAGWEREPSSDGRERGDAAGAAPTWSGAWPRVFTNVEARSRLCELTRPAPVLRLLRVPTDEVARELARELDL